MNFKEQNDIEREYYKQDFSVAETLSKRVRDALVKGSEIDTSDLDLKNIINYKGGNFFCITIFQSFTKKIKYSCKKNSLDETLNQIVTKLRENKDFKNFDIKNPNRTRLLFEWIVERNEVDIKKIHTQGAFDICRFEPGITGLEIVRRGTSYVWYPNDAVILNIMAFKEVLLNLGNRMGIYGQANLSENEKLGLIKNLEKTQFFLIKSKSFVTYKKEIIPLYRGNTLFEEYDRNKTIEIFKAGNENLIRNMKKNGQYTYYYNATEDNSIDHEHPKRREPNLYYNDIRHECATTSLLRMYEYTKEKKWLKYTKKALDWILTITQYHKDEKGRNCAYIFTNQKSKLGSEGLMLVCLMRYRALAKDYSYDELIEALVCHILSRISPKGEFLTYYIHPRYNNGNPLIRLSRQERRELFQFYYPGEALLGLGLFANNYDKNDELKTEVVEQSRKVISWMIEDRPNYYKDLYTSLPSDARFMQSIDEWSKHEGFIKQIDIDFVYGEARAMLDRIYKRDDSPYIDFEGGMYYDLGDHYYPDGARCEGLIAAYYLAKRMGNEEYAKEILEGCKKAAKCQFQLPITKYNNYAHLNPDKSEGMIKFKATRQWARIDTIQHVTCFFIRLYRAEEKQN